MGLEHRGKRTRSAVYFLLSLKANAGAAGFIDTDSAAKRIRIKYLSQSVCHNHVLPASAELDVLKDLKRFLVRDGHDSWPLIKNRKFKRVSA